jgi:hypothetical protein
MKYFQLGRVIAAVPESVSSSQIEVRELSPKAQEGI